MAGLAGLCCGGRARLAVKDPRPQLLQHSVRSGVRRGVCDNAPARSDIGAARARGENEKTEGSTDKVRTLGPLEFGTDWPVSSPSSLTDTWKGIRAERASSVGSRSCRCVRSV